MLEVPTGGQHRLSSLLRTNAVQFLGETLLALKYVVVQKEIKQLRKEGTLTQLKVKGKFLFSLVLFVDSKLRSFLKMFSQIKLHVLFPFMYLT